MCAVEALCEKCIPSIKDACFGSFKASSAKHVCDVKDRRERNIATRKKNMIIS